MWQMTSRKEFVTYFYHTNFMGKQWTLPHEGVKGYIQESAGEVLGIKSGSTVSGTEVVLQAKNESIRNDGQMWLRGPADSYGWFTLKNTKSGKLLTRSLIILLQVAYIEGL